VPTTAKIKYLLIFVLFNFTTYFLIQSFITTHKIDLLTDLDLVIPLIPGFVWIYHTLIPVIAITMIAFLKKKELFLTTLAAFILSSLILSSFYILLPSFYPREIFYGEPLSWTDWLYRLTQTIDGAHNTFPSGHVTYAWLIAIAIRDCSYTKKHHWLKNIFIGWAILISISTLVLKQHYIIDVVSGICLALLCYYFIRKLLFSRFKKSNYSNDTRKLKTSDARLYHT